MKIAETTMKIGSCVYFYVALIMVSLAAFGWIPWHEALPIVISAVSMGVTLLLIFCATIPPHNGKE